LPEAIADPSCEAADSTDAGPPGKQVDGLFGCNQKPYGCLDACISAEIIEVLQQIPPRGRT
jgi:hypothetical protein